MVVFSYILLGIVFILLVGGVWGMWTSNSDRMTDQQLYGMDADEYEKKMMGEENYRKYIDSYQHKNGSDDDALALAQEREDDLNNNR